jgi:peptidoglycan/LPS O-acetylase OafA/YrhL
MEPRMDSGSGAGLRASSEIEGGERSVGVVSPASVTLTSSLSVPAAHATHTNTTAVPGGRTFRVNNFDLLRILAATQVLVIHSMARLGIPVPGSLKWLEWFPGVPIFFVISGYLVSASFERQDNIYRYLKNRFLRIYPGLWACIGLTVVVTSALGYKRTHFMDFVWFPAQLLGFIYTPHFLKGFGAGTYNGSLWTIPIELQFYLMLPLVYLAWRRLRMGNMGAPFFLAVFIGINLILNYALPGFGTERESTVDKVIRYTFVSSFYMFLLGVTLQRFEAFKSRLIAGKGLHWIAAYVLLMIALPELSPFTTVLSYLILGISAVAVAYTVPRASELVLRGQDISYGVYIYHGLVVNLLLELKMRRGLYEVGVVLIAAFAVGAVSWKFIEEPFLRKKRRKLEAIPEEATSDACGADPVLGPGL